MRKQKGDSLTLILSQEERGKKEKQKGKESK
jgi:hypothetical protein